MIILKIHCPVFKHKIHCSQIEDTEASELSEERRYEFCFSKCPVWKKTQENVTVQRLSTDR